MTLVIHSQARQFCQECDEELPNFARQLFLGNGGLCPRCSLVFDDWGIDPRNIEYRDMRTKGRSQIAVPRIEYHTPSTAPKNSLPLAI